MSTIFGVPAPALYGQILIGLINGSFYAMLSLGLAVIFGLLRVINFAHCAQYMLGAFAAYLIRNYAGIGYWPALILAPLIVGAIAVVIERFMLSRLYGIDPLYGLLLTFGLALILEGAFRYWFGAAGQPYAAPSQLTGALNLGFMFMPIYRGWVVVASLVVCLGTWLLIEKTQLGAYLSGEPPDGHEPHHHRLRRRGRRRHGLDPGRHRDRLCTRHSRRADEG